MARRAILALLLALPPLARAQTTTTGLTIRETNDTDQQINIAECNGTISDGLVFSWTLSNFSVAGSYTLTASTQSGCPNASGTTATNVTLATIDAPNASGAWPTGGNQNIPALLTSLGINCSGGSTAVYFCVDYTPSAGVPIPGAVTGSIPLDLLRPPAPVITSITPGDSALNVSWDLGTGSPDAGTSGSSDSFTVVATSQVDPTDKQTKTVTGGRSTRIDGLKNDVTYDVIIYAFSPGGNQSDASATATGIPVVVLDFWRLYRGDGGREAGGCATGAAGLVALVALAPLLVRRRRRRS